MSMMKMIEEYDRKREGYIVYLEGEVERLKQQTNELTTLMMRATAASERKTIELIMSGAYDKFAKKESNDERRAEEQGPAVEDQDRLPST